MAQFCPQICPKQQLCVPRCESQVNPAALINVSRLLEKDRQSLLDYAEQRILRGERTRDELKDKIAILLNQRDILAAHREQLEAKIGNVEAKQKLAEVIRQLFSPGMRCGPSEWPIPSCVAFNDLTLDQLLYLHESFPPQEVQALPPRGLYEPQSGPKRRRTMESVPVPRKYQHPLLIRQKMYPEQYRPEEKKVDTCSMLNLFYSEDQSCYSDSLLMALLGPREPLLLHLLLGYEDPRGGLTPSTRMANYLKKTDRKIERILSIPSGELTRRQAESQMQKDREGEKFRVCFPWESKVRQKGKLDVVEFLNEVFERLNVPPFLLVWQREWGYDPATQTWNLIQARERQDLMSVFPLRVSWEEQIPLHPIQDNLPPSLRLARGNSVQSFLNRMAFYIPTMDKRRTQLTQQILVAKSQVIFLSIERNPLLLPPGPPVFVQIDPHIVVGVDRNGLEQKARLVSVVDVNFRAEHFSTYFTCHGQWWHFDDRSPFLLEGMSFAEMADAVARSATLLVYVFQQEGLELERKQQIVSPRAAFPPEEAAAPAPMQPSAREAEAAEVEEKIPAPAPAPVRPLSENEKRVIEIFLNSTIPLPVAEGGLTKEYFSKIFKIVLSSDEHPYKNFLIRQLRERLVNEVIMPLLERGKPFIVGQWQPVGERSGTLSPIPPLSSALEAQRQVVEEIAAELQAEAEGEAEEEEELLPGI